MSDRLVSNVSDTARWVAVYRAWESAKPDALFHDPLAARLAGEHGEAIAAMAPRQVRNGWPMIARTKLIDDLVMASVREGCDCVVNMAAGLDTRPYRLALPPSLEWIEADLPGMIEEKERVLAGEKPVCRLRRVKVDLSDVAARSELLDSAGSAQKALVLTEGFLIYLEEPQVRTLALDLAARRGIHWWLLDVASPAVKEMMLRKVGKLLENAPMKFAPPNGVAYFEAMGWKAQEICSVLVSAARFKRLPFPLGLFARLPQPDPRNVGRARWSAIVRFERTG